MRLNIGECIAAAYSTLSVAAATKMLMFTQPKETLEFISDYFTEWSVFGDTINLTMAKHVPRSEGIPSMKLITQTLSYATELERIV